MGEQQIIVPDAKQAIIAEKMVAYRDKLLATGGWPLTVGKGKQRRPMKDSQANVLKAIGLLNLECSYDIFRNSYTVEGFELGQGLVGDLGDKMIRAFRDYCFQMLRYEPGIAETREALKRACEARTYNSVQDYLKSTKWDRVPRLNTWLTVYCGAEDTPLHREWGRLYLIAACARAFEPGIKFDHVLSFEGPEGIGKSTVFKVLAGAKSPAELCPYFSDSTILDKDEKEQLELCQGIWFYELSEMAGAGKADRQKLKAFVVRQEDRAREAYAYFKSSQPRSPVFASTINPDPNTGDVPEYLNTGDRRRWWPLTVCAVNTAAGKVIDIEGLIRDRDQLFAEAMEWRDPVFETWPPLVPDPKLENEAKVAQIARQMKHPYRDILAPLYDRIIEWTRVPAAVTDDDWSKGRGKESGYRVTGLNVEVAAWFVLEQLPPNASSAEGGRIVPSVMGELGWKRVKKNTGNWYVQPLSG
jgi:predicted P-loop ATPase